MYREREREKERKTDILRKSIGNDICTRDPWCMTFMMYELKKIHRGNISICFMIMTCKKHCLAKYVSKRVKSYRMAFCFTDIKGRFYPFNLQTWKINVSWWIETRSRSKSVLLCISLFSSCLLRFKLLCFHGYRNCECLIDRYSWINIKNGKY